MHGFSSIFHARFHRKNERNPVHSFYGLVHSFLRRCWFISKVLRLFRKIFAFFASYSAIIFDGLALGWYRADDSYFDYAESFLNNAISVEQLAAAMKLGKLGEQIVLKSQFAFSRIRFEGFDVAEKEEFYVLRKARDDEANRLYLELLEEESDGLYIQDIIRGGITNDDSRIPRNISE